MEAFVSKSGFRQQIAEALGRRFPFEEQVLAGALALVVVAVWVALVTLPTALFGDLGGGYQMFMISGGLGLGMASFLLARMWMRRFQAPGLESTTPTQ